MDTIQDWEDIAFAGRHKGYGAYWLRKNYRVRLAGAALLVISSFLLIIPFLNASTPAVVYDSVYNSTPTPDLPLPPPPPALSTSATKQNSKRGAVHSSATHAKPKVIDAVATIEESNLHEPSSFVDPQAQASSLGGQQEAPGNNENDDIIADGEPEVAEGRDDSNSDRLSMVALATRDNGEMKLWAFNGHQENGTLTSYTYSPDFISVDELQLFGPRGYVHKGQWTLFVRIREAEAINVPTISEFAPDYVVLFNGLRFDVDEKYRTLLMEQVRFYITTYGNWQPYYQRFLPK